MSTTITWKPVRTVFDTSDKFIWKIHYTVEAKNGDYVADHHDKMTLDRPETLVSYDTLTEENLVTWIKNKLGTGIVLGIEGDLKNEICGFVSGTHKNQGLPYA
tara:strand:+ start:1386 stop:1694 length:309 start_codon:yes stop_codon:yes gene_type:complete